MAAAQEADIARVLTFWFDGPGRGKHYWAGGPEQQKELDDLISTEFGPLVALAARGGLTEAWCTSAEGSLALIILLDQFSRNVYRGTPGAFEQDRMAQEICLKGMGRQQDKELPDQPDESGSSKRQMFYLPLFHSEDVGLLEKGLELLPSVNYAWGIDNYTKQRIEDMKRFGRIPSRNKARGLESSPEEREAGH